MIDRTEPIAGIIEITINRPERHNAMTRQMWEDLAAEAASLPASTRVVLLRGAGTDFTSGFDLSDLSELSIPQVNEAFVTMERAISTIEHLPVPVVAMLDGYALGGGLELALAADIRIASRRARLGMPVAKLGIMLSRNFARRLVNDLGESRTKELLFTGRLLSGEEARVYGLANLVEDSGLIYERTLETCRMIASHYPNAVRQAKTAVDSVTIAPDEDQAPYYVDAQDFREAVRRFAPNRPLGAQTEG